MERPAIIAHRLGGAYGLDSSATALERTLAGPVDGLETDVCLCADGRLVLLHDPLLALGTTLTGWAHQRTSAEILAASLRDGGGRATDEHPLAVEELLDRVPAAMPLQLEVKAHADPELAARTATALCTACDGDRDRVEVISFHTSACEAAAAAGFRSRLVLFADYEPDALVAWVGGRGIAAVAIEHFLLGEELVGALRAAGIGISTGTVNAPELLRRALVHRPDAICTDRPHELASWLGAGGVRIAA